MTEPAPDDYLLTQKFNSYKLTNPSVIRESVFV